MKKYVAGIGLLCAALMFFSCKQPAAPKLDKISAHETIEIPSNLGKNPADTLPSGLTLGSGEELHVYAARMSGEEVSTLFGSAYYVTNSTSATLTKINIDAIKAKLGGLFYVGDNFNIGYRVVKTASGEIVRSKVVAVKVVSPYKNYVANSIGDLSAEPKVAFVYSLGGKDAAGADVPSAWYVKVTLNKPLPTMTARVLLGGTKKIEDVKEEDLPYTKAEIVEVSSTQKDTVFLCKVDTAKIEKGVPLHARVEFKDIEDASVNAKTVATLSLPKVDPTKPEYAWAMSVNTELGNNTPLITTENPEERIVEKTDGLMITINNTAANFTDLYLNTNPLKKSYRYQLSTAADFAGAVWNKATGNTVTLNNLTANTVYYLKAEVAYIVIGSGSNQQYQLQKVVSPAVSFKTRDEYNTSGFVFDYSDDAHRIRKYVDATTQYWDGHYDNTPAGLLTTAASSTEASLQLDNGKTIQSKAADYKYSSGALNFKMRLPSERDLNTLLATVNAKQFKLVDNTGAPITGYADAGEEELATLEVDTSVKVRLCYYAPTYKASNDASGNADWTLSEQGMVKLLIEANNKETPAATAVLATTGHQLADPADLNNIPASQVASKVQAMSFDANAWTTWADCAITFTKEKITAKVGTVSHEVSFEKSKHPDLVEEGYKQFTLTSKLDGLRVDNVKYVVTK